MIGWQADTVSDGVPAEGIGSIATPPGKRLIAQIPDHSLNDWIQSIADCPMHETILRKIIDMGKRLVILPHRDDGFSK